MNNYIQTLENLDTPVAQTERERTDQVKNNAGGYVFDIGKWGQFERFLILGSTSGTYYASGLRITEDCSRAILECLAENPGRVLETLVSFNDDNRCAKQDTLLFTLALIVSSDNKVAANSAGSLLPVFARTTYHLATFMNMVTARRSWGRILKRAVANWYMVKSNWNLLYQIFKSQQREGWSHKDLITLAHPKPDNAERSAFFKFIVKDMWGENEIAEAFPPALRARFLNYSALKSMMEIQPEQFTHETVQRALDIIENDSSVTWEMLPTFLLGEKHGKTVWPKLIPNMGMTATIRKLGQFTSLGLIKERSDDLTTLISNRISSKEELIRQRIHPLTAISALNVYSSGHGVKGDLKWTPSPEIKESLEAAVEFSFKNTPPINKRVFIAVDVSHSMTLGDINGFPGISPRIGAGILAKIFSIQAQDYWIYGFSTKNGKNDVGRGGRFWAMEEPEEPYENFLLRDLNINDETNFETIIHNMQEMPYGGTDCSLPMIFASEHNLEVDAFVIITDNETWAGGKHSHKALEDYRKKSGINAKLAVIGMTATNFSIADPDDPYSMDMIGMDSNSPAILHSFITG